MPLPWAEGGACFNAPSHAPLCCLPPHCIYCNTPFTGCQQLFKKVWLFSVSLNQRLPPWAVPNCGFLSGFVRYPLRSPTVIILYYGITKVNYFWEKILNRPDRSGAEEKCEPIKFFKTRLVSLGHEALNAKARGLPSLSRYRLHTLRSRSARR